ncbi:hypothetical protein GH714_032243 [Hevea brasiliensis]|uniref:Uncharacterized protein n=1 Tax=Hevea brasiliensis TaxID=3981 RepID=A0A6A6N8S5_HEVBR|nr:hypothetical protein GH714_032243 [Hevea brasiliensis]
MGTQSKASPDSMVIDMGDSIINSNFNEENWISKIKGILNKEQLGHEIDNPTNCIFQVPKSVSSIKPEAFIPQRIALGPYHHFRPKFYKMQKCKLHEVQIVHQRLKLPEFQLLFDQLKRKVKDVRGYYHEHLDIHDDTLSWIMVIDGLFLLQLICDEQPLEFVDSSGRKFPMEAILRDVVLLENQIPFFVLEHLLARSNPATKIQSLLSMTIKFCPRISPVALQGYFPKKSFECPLHLLDLLYNLVWFGGFPVGRDNAVAIGRQRSFNVWSALWDMISSLNVGFLVIPKKIIDLILKILQVLGISISLQFTEEKALTPTASQLSSVKVKFCHTGLGISFIYFTKEDTALHLPVFTLNVNSEVIIRNLLAYEAVIKPETPNFARYIELMAAMIHTTEDVELLKNNKIVMHEGDNGEVVKLFNGLRNSLVSGGESELDHCIKEVNEYYNSSWKIKFKNLIKKNVYSSWKMLTIIATILLLLLMALQTFCSIYSCPGIFKTSKKHLSLTSSF